jgi:hypothetical protein
MPPRPLHALSGERKPTPPPAWMTGPFPCDLRPTRLGREAPCVRPDHLPRSSPYLERLPSTPSPLSPFTRISMPHADRCPLRRTPLPDTRCQSSHPLLRSAHFLCSPNAARSSEEPPFAPSARRSPPMHCGTPEPYPPSAILNSTNTLSRLRARSGRPPSTTAQQTPPLTTWMVTGNQSSRTEPAPPPPRSPL